MSNVSVVKTILQEEPYVLVSWVNAFLNGFQMEGLDYPSIVSKSGIDTDLLKSGYCSLATLDAIFDAAQALYGDSVGIISRKGVTPSVFRSLSFAVLSSDTLADGFDIVVKHNPSITNVLHFFVERGDHNAFGFDVRKGVDISFPFASAILVTALRTSRFIHPGYRVATKIEMIHSEPVSSEAYERYFGAPIVWGCQRCMIHFDTHAFLSTSKHSNHFLRLNAEQSWFLEVAQFKELNFMLRAYAFVRANLSGVRLTVEYIADEFGMSVRTFQRRLDEENSSFSQLIDQVRKEEAKKLISNDNISITDVAISLGFSRPGTLSRAFRRWFDQSPEQYRKNRC